MEQKKSPKIKTKGKEEMRSITRMKILVINPNTSIDMSKTIDKVAKKCASPGTDVTTMNPQHGPMFISNAYDVVLQAPRVIKLIEKNKRNYDAFIISCGSDPRLETCRLVTKKVIGAGTGSDYAQRAVFARRD